MRMRRTAFIMALMTVFTVSLFAQNSRGRNYIKQNISEWGGCRNVAITDTGGDLALNGKNDYAYTAGIPQALADALEKYHDDDDYIDDVQLTEDGEWLILVGKNGCQWSNIPSELESKLRQWNEAEETILRDVQRRRRLDCRLHRPRRLFQHGYGRLDQGRHRDSRTVVGCSPDQRRLRALLRERIQVSRQRAPETKGCPQGHEV